MSDYEISEVDPIANADIIREYNLFVPIWPKLQQRHFIDGYWWLAYLGDEHVGFAGMVPFEPCPNVGYLKRCYVKQGHHGHGLQFRFILAREIKAYQLGWKTLVTEVPRDNYFSTANFFKAGYRETNPEQPWAENSVFLVKYL